MTSGKKASSEKAKSKNTKGNKSKLPFNRGFQFAEIKMKTALVLGAGGFIGSHLVKRLKRDGFHVRAVDLKHPEFSKTEADEFVIGDLRDQNFCKSIFDKSFHHVYQLAADMGGAGYLFTGEHDADVMHNSAQINLNVAALCVEQKVDRLFYSSSACIYPEYNQEDTDHPKCSEDSVYPAQPDSEYGWEKLFSERLYLSCFCVLLSLCVSLMCEYEV